VAERIIEVTGHRLEIAPNLEFVQVPGRHGLHPFWLAKRLWRLDPALREGSPSDLLDYIDGVLLIHLWDDLHLPDHIRRVRHPLIQQTRGTN
jgi:hypothetical protein